MGFVHILRFRLRRPMGRRFSCRNVFTEKAGARPHCRRHIGISGFHRRLLGHSRPPSAQDNGGDPALVFVLHDALGNADLYEMGI